AQGADARLVVGDEDTRLRRGGTAGHWAHLGDEPACGRGRERGKKPPAGEGVPPPPAGEGDAGERSSVGGNGPGGPDPPKKPPVFPPPPGAPQIPALPASALLQPPAERSQGLPDLFQLTRPQPIVVDRSQIGLDGEIAIDRGRGPLFVHSLPAPRQH